MAKAAISRLSESQKIGFNLFVASMGYNTDEEFVDYIELSYSYSDPRDLSIDLIREDCIINAEDFICNKGKKKSAKEMAKITELVKSAVSQMDNLDKFDLLMIEGCCDLLNNSYLCKVNNNNMGIFAPILQL